LTGGVAHDFNNLLTAIMGSLELLGKRITDQRQRRYLETASSAARRGASLTQQLLAYARKQHLAPKPVDVAETVHGMEEMLRRSLGGLIQIDIQMPAGLWHAYADPTQFELVVLNLAINARDAMPLGGTLWIEARNMESGSPGFPADLAAGDYVCIAVRDSGNGMPAEVLARAFEPFFTTKEVGKGSGLGLAQTYGFAQQLGGTVRIDSTVGVGTCVEVILPRARAGTAAEAGSTEPDGVCADASRVSLMLVDDDDEVRSVAATLLREAGYEVSDYSDGPAALAALESGARAAVLLVDVAMPAMSGIEVARQVRQRLPAMPIVFLTGNADPDVVDNLAGPVLSKPFALKDLLRAVEQAAGAASA
jgi:CheY-like chemotaxis protein